MVASPLGIKNHSNDEKVVTNENIRCINIFLNILPLTDVISKTITSICITGIVHTPTTESTGSTNFNVESGMIQIKHLNAYLSLEILKSNTYSSAINNVLLNALYKI